MRHFLTDLQVQRDLYGRVGRREYERRVEQVVDRTCVPSAVGRLSLDWDWKHRDVQKMMFRYSSVSRHAVLRTKRVQGRAFLAA